MDENQRNQTARQQPSSTLNVHGMPSNKPRKPPRHQIVEYNTAAVRWIGDGQGAENHAEDEAADMFGEN